MISFVRYQKAGPSLRSESVTKFDFCSQPSRFGCAARRIDGRSVAGEERESRFGESSFAIVIAF